MLIDKDYFSAVLNIAKALAIIGIIFFHLFVDIGKGISDPSGIVALIMLPSKVGSQGVLLFFFASGYGLMMSHLDRKVNDDLTWLFLKRRLLKIYPAYILSIVLVLSLYYGFDIQTDRIYFAGILSDFLLVRNYFEYTIHGLNGNWWFVATIFQLYIVFMVSSLWVKKFSWHTIIVVGLAIDIAYKVLLVTLNYFQIISVDASSLNPYTAFCFNYIGTFFLGIGVAKYIKIMSPSFGCRYLTIYVMVFIMLFEYIGYKISFSATGKIFNDIFFTFSYIPFLLLISIYIKKYTSAAIIAGISFIGALSYEIYLIHHPMIKISLYLWGATNMLLMSGLMVVSTLSVAYVMTKIISRYK